MRSPSRKPAPTSKRCWTSSVPTAKSTRKSWGTGERANRHGDLRAFESGAIGARTWGCPERANRHGDLRAFESGAICARTRGCPMSEAPRPRAAALALAVGLVLADSSIVVLALPEIYRELDASVTAVSWVLISFNLVMA